jgi:hypothetical protein
MANHEVKRRKVGAYAKTLSANTIDKVTFADEPPSVEVVNRDGLAAIYVTVDGSDPTIGGEGTHELPAARCSRVIPVPNKSGRPAADIKLISPGTPSYSVSRVAD